jgi:hypothetical protein
MKPKVSMPNEPLTKLEQEVVVLYAVWDMIFGMVNRSMFKTDFLPAGELHFRSHESQSLFAILIADFLSLPSEGIFGLPRPVVPSERIDRTFLFYLKKISLSPCLEGNAASLMQTVDLFAHWLNAKTVIPNIWLPTLEIEVTLQIHRITLLELCGNAAKHGFARLSGDVGLTEQLLKNHGHNLSDGKSFHAHAELTEWLAQEGPLNYLAPVVAEHLNNIRWALYEYLTPVFQKYAYSNDGRHFRFHFPVDCNLSLVREFYWSLMNEVIREPFFPRFTLNEHVRNIL